MSQWMHLGLPRVGKPLNLITLYRRCFHWRPRFITIGNQVGDSYQEIDIFNDHDIPQEGASLGRIRQPPITFGEWGMII
jgi:hypothetical protein